MIIFKHFGVMMEENINWKNIIDSLRNGEFPKEEFKFLCVGRDNEITDFDLILDLLNDSQKSMSCFIKADYSKGKTFFLQVIEEIALEKNFVVSSISLSNEINMDKMDVVYNNIVKNLKCKTGTSLKNIIDYWISNINRNIVQEESSPQIQNEIINEYIYKDLIETYEHSNSFATAIKNYALLKNNGDYKTADYALSWIMGEFRYSFFRKKEIWR